MPREHLVKSARNLSSPPILPASQQDSCFVTLCKSMTYNAVFRRAREDSKKALSLSFLSLTNYVLYSNVISYGCKDNLVSIMANKVNQEGCMKGVFFLTVCLTLLAAGTAQAVYTEANAYWGTVVDSGDKPYSSVDYSSSYFRMAATAEAGNDWAKGISLAECITKPANEGNAKSISRFTTTFEVISDGFVSLDLFLDGELRVFVQNTFTGSNPFKAGYNLSVSDNISNDSINLSGNLSSHEAGTHITPVNITETYEFGGATYTAGTLIDVTLELQTNAHASYGYGVGSFAKSDFSNSLTIGNLDNLVIVPEPASIILLLLGGIGLSKLRRR